MSVYSTLVVHRAAAIAKLSQIDWKRLSDAKLAEMLLTHVGEQHRYNFIIVADSHTPTDNQYGTAEEQVRQICCDDQTLESLDTEEPA